MLFFINFESLFSMNIVDYVFVNPNGNYSWLSNDMLWNCWLWQSNREKLQSRNPSKHNLLLLNCIPVPQKTTRRLSFLNLLFWQKFTCPYLSLRISNDSSKISTLLQSSQCWKVNHSLLLRQYARLNEIVWCLARALKCIPMLWSHNTRTAVLGSNAIIIVITVFSIHCAMHAL